jgi:hypothetical protein
MSAHTAPPVPFALRRHEPSETIEWKEYPRIEPGEYFANCYWAKRYRDPGFKRWTCLLRWDVLSEDLQRTIAKCVPLWFPLGSGEAPHASRRGKYLREWVRANGGPPEKGDRLSPRVFTRKVARVEIGDTESPAPYSVVRKIIRWETGIPGHSVISYTSQGRQAAKPVGARGFEPCR